MKNLVFYADGTWNSDEQGKHPTNVRLLSQIAGDHLQSECAQITHYQIGVGAKRFAIARLIEGGLGTSLDEKIKEAYRWLAENYQSGDRIFLFGFSRGAYTVRSLVGMINKSPLPNFFEDNTSSNHKNDIVDACFSEYRARNIDSKILNGVKRHPTIDIEFLGVWDTVGALGIPDEVSILRSLSKQEKYHFYDTELSSNVKCARHAVAIDEQRKTFVPTLWTNIPEDWDVEQKWFVGVHSNVGGGYPTRGLSDIALDWMIKEAQTSGLVITSDVSLSPDPQGELVNSRTGIFGALKARPRATPNLSHDNKASTIDPSVRDRQLATAQDAQPYWATTLLAKDQSLTIQISAKKWWAPTSLYLESGATYRLEAVGQWQDWFTTYGPEGAKEKKRQLGHKFGDAWGRFEKLFTAEDAEPSTFSPERRFPNLPWFALVGIIANGAGENPDNQTATPHQAFAISDMPELTVAKGGYLYCCANDGWKWYFNNGGGLTLTVTRIS